MSFMTPILTRSPEICAWAAADSVSAAATPARAANFICRSPLALFENHGGTEVTEVKLGHSTNRRKPCLRATLLKFISKPTWIPLRRKIGQHLCLVYRRDVVDRLDLQDERSFDDDVHAVATVQANILIDHRQRHLSPVVDRRLLQFETQALFVSRFE